ncbi:GNAT family N-acetyltransferase [Candidatus Poribacteria bacterium]
MATEEQTRSTMPISLGDELALRFGRAEDIDDAVGLFTEVWEREDMGIWLRDLMSGAHPNVSFRDFTVVEDTSKGKIVSYMGLISQNWLYGGVPFKCGQVESVVTDPEYRRRGLVRKQLEVIHELSNARGELMQVIWGIPWYYRMFGYEYAMDSALGRLCHVYKHHIPELKDNEVEPYILRPVTAQDYSFLRQIYEQSVTRHQFSAVKTDRDWDFYIRGRSSESMTSCQWLIIEDANCERIGYLNYQNANVKRQIVIFQLELSRGYGYTDVMPSLLRGLWRIGSKISSRSEDGDVFSRIRFVLGRKHPGFAALPQDVAHIDSDTPVWYIRIPDIVAFLNHVKPALEANLVGTAAEGYTGELKINFFRSGLQMQFDLGRVLNIAPWQADGFWHVPCFPDLTFLQLLCGHKRCAELVNAFPDCRIDDRSALLLDSLFPPFSGNLWLGN